MSQDFAVTILELIGIAVAVFLVVAGLVFAANAGRAKRYRPGRPFSFTPVWFLSAPRKPTQEDRPPGRELVAGAPKVNRRRETGGASDSW